MALLQRFYKKYGPKAMGAKVKGLETCRLYEQGKTGGADWLKKLFAHGMKFYILFTTSWATGLLIAPAILSLKNDEVVFV